MLFYRFVTTRTIINKYGKKGFKPQLEWFRSDDEEFIKQANYKLHIKFKPVESKADDNLLDALLNSISELEAPDNIRIYNELMNPSYSHEENKIYGELLFALWFILNLRKEKK